MTYWIYQHLGNLSPEAIRREGILAAVSEQPDGTAVLRAWADRAENERRRLGFLPVQLRPRPGGGAAGDDRRAPRTRAHPRSAADDRRARLAMDRRAVQGARRAPADRLVTPGVRATGTARSAAVERGVGRRTMGPRRRPPRRVDPAARSTSRTGRRSLRRSTRSCSCCATSAAKQQDGRRTRSRCSPATSTSATRPGSISRRSRR